MSVESMEGRLMLSATTLDFSMLSQQPLQFATAADEQQVVALTSEGGQIPVHFSSSDMHFDGNHVLPTTWRSTTTIQQLIQDTSLGSSVSGTSAFDEVNSIFRPEIFAGDLDAVSIDEPPATGRVGSAIQHEEGGAISIASILTSEELDAPQLRHLVAEPTETSNSIAATRSAIGEAISGEWARAVAFEMAGGEPASNSRPVVNANDSAAMGLQIPFEQYSRAIRTLVNPVQATDESQATPTRLLLDGEPERPNAPKMSKVGPRINSDEASIAAPVQRTSLYRQEINRETDALTPASAEYAKAFEQLADEETSGSWLAPYSRRALSATPLLLVLALERVTARKSRRGSVQTPIVTGVPPRGFEPLSPP
jgi:hypothetical protein